MVEIDAVGLVSAVVDVEDCVEVVVSGFVSSVEVVVVGYVLVLVL